MALVRTITRWGNSLAVRLPSQVFNKTNFKEGDEVVFEVDGDDSLRLIRADIADGRE